MMKLTMKSILLDGTLKMELSTGLAGIVMEASGEIEAYSKL